MRRREFLTCGLALAGTSSSALADNDDWVPFAQGHGVHVPVTINGQYLTAMIDSGAGEIVLDREAARRLGIGETDRTMSAVGLTEARQVSISTPFELRVGRARLRVQSALIGDLSATRLVDGEGVDILLGRGVFDLFVVDFDFIGRRLAFRRRFSPSSDAALLSLRPAGRGLRVVDVSIAEGAPVPAVFDLGAVAGLTISAAYAREQRLLEGMPTSTWVSVGIEGLTEYRTATLPAIAIGPFAFENVPTDVYDAWASLQPANVGYEIWRRFGRVTVDYPNERLYLTAPQAPPAPFSRNRAGLATIRAPDRLRIAHVAQASPAAAAGWRVGDEIVAVDGALIAQAYDASWAYAEAGREVTFTMADGSTRRLVLANYY